MGTPVMRRPTPLEDTPRTDDAGVAWRIAESDRPDATYCVDYREPGADQWSKRYVFSDVSRPLHYFAATCEYLESAPESPFTGDPIVSIATEAGHRKLSGEALTETSGGDEVERTVSGEEWHATLAAEFGLRYGGR